MNEEEVLGIGTYLTPDLPGIGGRLKMYPEDFIVNEISINPEQQEGGKYTIARIRTRNWETNQLVREMATQLRISRKKITYAGTKDKRAITTQLFCFQAPMDEVLKINLPGFMIIDAYPSNKKIMLGDLIGNKFNLVVRNIELPESEIKNRVDKIYENIMKSQGVPNFFGVQRFGSVRPLTHLVGKAIIKGNFKEAVRLYVGAPQKYEDETLQKIRKYFDETFDYEKTLKEMPPDYTYERTILHRLVETGGDCVSALSALPDKLLTLFIHAYQSYIFNKVLTLRLKKNLPLNEPVVGDILCPVKYPEMVPDNNIYINVTNDNLEKSRKQCIERKAFVTGVLPGREPVFATGLPGEIEMEIFEGEHLVPEDFIVPDFPGITTKGKRRELLLRVFDFKYITGEKTCEFEFWLTKGNYATTVMREFMKARSLVDYS